MPIYEYQCTRCAHEFEKLVFAGDDAGVTCPECDSPEIKKKMSAASVLGSDTGSCASHSPKGFS